MALKLPQPKNDVSSKLWVSRDSGDKSQGSRRWDPGLRLANIKTEGFLPQVSKYQENTKKVLISLCQHFPS